MQKQHAIVVLIVLMVLLLYTLGSPNRVSKLDLPMGYSILAGTPWGDGYPLAIYLSRDDYRVGDIVVFCVAGNCYAGMVSGERRGQLEISGWGPVYPVYIPKAGNEVYRVEVLIPARAWLPIAAIIAWSLFMAATPAVGRHWALPFALLVVASIIITSISPALATAQLPAPILRLRSFNVSSDYSIVTLNVDWNGVKDPRVGECTVYWGSNRFNTVGTVVGDKILVPIPLEAWTSALAEQKSKLVFLNLDCKITFEYGVVNSTTTIWAVMAEPRLEVRGSLISLYNQAPTMVNYTLDIVVYRGGGHAEVLRKQGYLSPGGVYSLYLPGTSRVIVNGVVYTPWGSEPVGAVGGSG